MISCPMVEGIDWGLSKGGYARGCIFHPHIQGLPSIIARVCVCVRVCVRVYACVRACARSGVRGQVGVRAGAGAGVCARVHL